MILQTTTSIGRHWHGDTSCFHCAQRISALLGDSAFVCCHTAAMRNLFDDMVDFPIMPFVRTVTLNVPSVSQLSRVWKSLVAKEVHHSRWRSQVPLQGEGKREDSPAVGFQFCRMTADSLVPDTPPCQCLQLSSALVSGCCWTLLEKPVFIHVQMLCALGAFSVSQAKSFSHIHVCFLKVYLKNFNYRFVFLCLCTCMWAPVEVRGGDSLELEKILSCPTWMLRSSGRAQCAPNCCAVSSALAFAFFHSP